MFNSGWMNEQHNAAFRRERLQEAEDYRRAQELIKEASRVLRRDPRRELHQDLRQGDSGELLDE